MKNDGTHISSTIQTETFVNYIHRIYLKIRTIIYTFWNKRRFGKVGAGFISSGPIHVVNGKCITIGDNVFLGEHCQLYAFPNGKISIGNNTSIDRHVEIRGGKNIIIKDDIRIIKGTTIKAPDTARVIIGNRTIISQGCIFDGEVEIGEDVIFGPNVFINEADHGFSRKDIPMNQQEGNSAKIVIEDDVWIGYNAAILKGVHISKGSIIGSLAVVNKSVVAYSINAGIPSKVIKYRE